MPTARGREPGARGQLQCDHSQRGIGPARGIFADRAAVPLPRKPAKAIAQQSRSRGKQEKQAPRGITVSGEVKNYVPVTDAMLRNPDPADWLMIRRDYKANYFAAESDHRAERE